MDYYAKKQGVGQDNRRKKKKTNGLIGLITGGGGVQPKEERENEWISRS